MTFAQRSRLMSGIALIALGIAILGGGCPFSSPSPDDGQNGDACRCDTGVQIEIQTRFLTVNDSFLDDTDLDLNSTLQFGAGSSISRSYFPAEPTNDRLAVFLGLPGEPSGGALASLFAPPSIVSPVGLRSTLLTGSELSNLLVEAAIQQEVVMTGPKITLEVGESAFIMLKNEERFISELEPTFVNALTDVNQVVISVVTGPALELEPRGSEDGTIVLNLRPSVGVMFNTANVEGDRPLVQLARTQTTVRIPDGGTLLLGGLINTASGARSQSVLPFLGNVPIISRFSDNRLVKDNDNLIILVTPNIVPAAD